ncbi:hypothetical protein CYMTET_53229 [Cymbomonas tetramitiformis]|uniref:Uncharacterized protein n=1 Tax=Cymbomonas tetramitiformis TaxID=36881 RepID=A0AAE0BHG4_9CHLO|nr:hypothetical protein CYMTET_53229 [Cymbomonas tetramitiformis]
MSEFGVCPSIDFDFNQSGLLSATSGQTMADLNSLTVHLVAAPVITAGATLAPNEDDSPWTILRTRTFGFPNVGPLTDETAAMTSLWDMVKRDLQLHTTDDPELYAGPTPSASRVSLETVIRVSNPVVYLRHHQNYGDTVRVGRPCPRRGIGRAGGPHAGLAVKSVIRKSSVKKLTPNQQKLAGVAMLQTLNLTPTGLSRSTSTDSSGDSVNPLQHAPTAVDPAVFSPPAQPPKQRVPAAVDPAVFNPPANPLQHAPTAVDPAVFSPPAQPPKQRVPAAVDPAVFNPPANPLQHAPTAVDPAVFSPPAQPPELRVPMAVDPADSNPPANPLQHAPTAPLVWETATRAMPVNGGPVMQRTIPSITVPVPAAHPSLFRSMNSGVRPGELLRALSSPKQIAPKAPSGMKVPTVVKEANIRAGKQRVKAGVAVCSMMKKFRVGRGKTELAKIISGCEFNKYGEWAGQDADCGLSVPVKVCKMVVDLKPTVEDTLSYWRAVVVAVNVYTKPCPPSQCKCGKWADSESDEEEDVVSDVCACPHISKCQLVLDTHVFHGDSSYLTADLDQLVEEQELQHVPDILLNEQYQIVDERGVLVPVERALSREDFPSAPFKKIGEE